MNDICYVFLAYGKDYVKEFLRIAPYFPKEHILVYSDREIKNYHTYTSTKPFNFNLKFEALKKALKEYNKVLILDTDITVKDFNPDYLSNLKPGLTVKWIGDRVNYLGHKINSETVSNGTTPLIDVNEYGKELFNQTKNKVRFIDESSLFFYFTNKHEKILFLSNLEYLLVKIKDSVPIREGKPGSLEGCLLNAVATMGNLNIYKNKKIFDKMFYHYGPVNGHNISFKQKVI